jgi:adenine-specific DNA-methyltransferase
MEFKELKGLLQKPYTTDNWRSLLGHVFEYVQFLDAPIIIPTDDDRVNQLKQYGTVRLSDGKNLALFELTLNDNVNLIRNRVGLNELVKKYIDQDSYHGILSIFEQGKEDYRFTFTARNTEFDEDQGFIDKDTDTKRFTYILGANESCRTAAERFDALSKTDNKDIKAVEDAFNVEKLSKKFFKEYIEQFNTLVASLKSKPSYFQGIFEKDETSTRNFVKRFMGRLVFLKFIQKKGWLGVPVTETGWNNGEYQFLEDQYKAFDSKGLFVSQFLNPLFFEALNVGDRTKDEFQSRGYKIPYLSGGLFDDDNTKENRIDFEERELTNLFDFFERYNFTIDENDLHDKEVGIDPEMLGHIFENLLEDNKDKGAFYTPKEIVRYMCQESLKEYLKTYLEKQQLWPSDNVASQNLTKTLAAFVEKKETAAILRYDKELATALRDVKICDPAIGSGAFPMGLLNEIFTMIKNLHDESPDRVGDVWGMQGDTWQPNIVKQNIIQNSIYGVDIEAGAVDIARLRFWLSLVIEEDEPKPLPHLDYKIVEGDSLVSKLDNTVIDINWKAKEEDQGFFTGPKTEQKLKLLKEITELHKDAFDPKSDQDLVALNIRNKKIELLIIQLEIMIEKQNIVKAPKITDYQNKSKTQFQKDTYKYLETLGWLKHIKELEHAKTLKKVPLNYFDWKLDYPEVLNDDIATSYGFDIVIGNPPYFQIQKIEEKEKVILQKAKFKTFTKSGDIYSLFYERGLSLLKDKGVLVFITSNSWMKTKYGESLRLLMIEESCPLKLLNFEDTQIFPSATVEANIIFLKKAKYNLITESVSFKKDFKDDSIVKYFEKNKVILKSLDKSEWIILSKKDFNIKGLIEHNNKKLIDFNYKIISGVKTGLNKAFLIDEEVKEKLISTDSKNLDIIKPIVRGRDIKRFKNKEGDSYCIFAHNGNKKLVIRPIDVKNDYPSVFEYLESFNKEIKERPSQGVHWSNVPTNYLKEFTEQKIIWGELSDKPKFALDENQCLTEATVFNLTGDNLRYLLVILNSKLCEWYFQTFTTTSGMGTNRWKKYKMEKIPISLSNKTNQNKIEIIADYLIILNDIEIQLDRNIEKNKLICELFEDVSNMMVFELYFEKHMKQNKIDVLQFVDFTDLSKIDSIEEKTKVIQKEYNKLIAKDNPIRNRILLSNTRSSDIIKRINESTH